MEQFGYIEALVLEYLEPPNSDILDPQVFFQKSVKVSETICKGSFHHEQSRYDICGYQQTNE